MVGERQGSRVQEVGGEATAVPDAHLGAPEPRWSDSRAFLLAPFYPATAARRTGHISLRRMWVIHFEVAFLTVVVIFLLIVWQESWRAWGGVAYWLGAVLNDLGREFRDSPLRMSLTTVGIALAVEAGFLALALFAMPWGARDEPLGQCYRTALNRTWLRTAHAMLVVAISGVAIIVLDRLWEAFWAGGVFDFRPWYMFLITGWANPHVFRNGGVVRLGTIAKRRGASCCGADRSSTDVRGVWLQPHDYRVGQPLPGVR